jgi:predicted amidohydrolase
VVKRLLDLLGQARARGCDLVVFPELALTTFFPRWWMEDQAEIDAKVHLAGHGEHEPSRPFQHLIAPSGEIVARAATLGDELVIARCDLDLTRSYKETIFNFAHHRRPEHYRLIVDRAGAEPPEEGR